MDLNTAPNPSYNRSREESGYLEDTYVLYELDLPPLPKGRNSNGRQPDLNNYNDARTNTDMRSRGTRMSRRYIMKIKTLLWVLLIVSICLAVVALTVAITLGATQQNELHTTSSMYDQQMDSLHQSLMELQSKYETLSTAVIALGNFNTSNPGTATNGSNSTASLPISILVSLFERCMEETMEVQSERSTTNRIYSHYTTTQSVPINITGYYTVNIRCEIDYLSEQPGSVIDTSHVIRTANSVACGCGLVSTINDEIGSHIRLSDLPTYTCRMAINRCPLN